MNGTDINDTSLKTRYPKLSSDTDSTFLGGLVLEKSIVDPTYGFENCQNLSTFKMFLTAHRSGLYSKGLLLSILSFALRTSYRLYTLWVQEFIHILSKELFPASENLIMEKLTYSNH